MSELKISISGVRGIWNESLTFEVLFKYLNAFANFLLKRKAKKILVGRDGRITGGLILNLTNYVITSYGIDVYDGGIIPTPTVLFEVRRGRFDGGLIITASHNPEEWNALKFVSGKGYFFSESELNELLSYIDLKFEPVQYKKVGKQFNYGDICKFHIDSILKHIDSDVIRAKSFKVVLDPVNSAGGEITFELLNKLGCNVVMVNGEVNGFFGRKPEPTPENLTHLKKIVLKNRATIGFAQDPDADRLVIVDENGNVLSEEFTLALCVKHILSMQKGDVVINLSTSMMSEEIAKSYGCKCYRTKVGEANVVEGIVRYKAIIGGEGNGGVIYPQINLARDSLTGIAIILEMLALNGKKISEEVSSLPKFFMKKDKISVSKNWKEISERVYNYLCKDFSDISVIDGLWANFKGNKKGWIHIRPSNTEPVIRIIGESEDEALLESVFLKIRELCF
ncbi:MAG: phosphoglucosamine mutase [Brevinematia bacterium]